MEVVVGSGLIGRQLYYYLRRFKEVVLTTREELDLTRIEDVPDCEVAYICAGVTSSLECEGNPLKTREVNVQGTVKLCSKLIDKGAFVVWLSSERVFDG